MIKSPSASYDVLHKDKDHNNNQINSNNNNIHSYTARSNASSGATMSGRERRFVQSLEEQQLLLFIIDLMGSLRRATAKQNMFGRELISLRLSISIILSCMSLSTESSAEKICTEVSLFLIYFISVYNKLNFILFLRFCF